jgi:hypothetical protein
MEPVYAIIMLYAAAALFGAVLFLGDRDLRSWVLNPPSDNAAGARKSDSI